METVKLYYEDCHIREFTAKVCACQASDRGFLVVLDATAFYPEGGGQACDLGTIDDANVLDVQENGNEILHLCDKKLEIGKTVTGRIDWARRFDLMQQHSGEHIVSGIVHSLLGHHNVGFHVGSDRMEIDFDGPIPADMLQKIETKANEAVWENLPIRCYYPAEDALPHVFYRTKKALPWPVRIVEIPGYDSCACCGVHVKKTGEIGPIKILSCIKFHQGVRVELTCGRRALRWLQTVFEQNRQVSQAFSAQMTQTGEAARKMNEVLAAEKLRANTLQTRLFEAVAAGYAGQKNAWRFETELTAAQARSLADKMADHCSGWAAVFAGAEGNYSLCIVSRKLDVKSIGQALGARGGGKTGFFQGSVQANRCQIEAILKQQSEV